MRGRQVPADECQSMQSGQMFESHVWQSSLGADSDLSVAKDPMGSARV